MNKNRRARREREAWATAVADFDGGMRRLGRRPTTRVLFGAATSAGSMAWALRDPTTVVLDRTVYVLPGADVWCATTDKDDPNGEPSRSIRDGWVVSGHAALNPILEQSLAGARGAGSDLVRRPEWVRVSDRRQGADRRRVPRGSERRRPW